MRGRLAENHMEEWICMVRVIDGVVAEKTLESKLIRCKDCKHYRPHEISKGLPYCEWNGSLTYDDEFCSHAERREE